MPTYRPSRPSASIQQALDESPLLAQLGAQVRLTQRMLACVQAALPAGLRETVLAGPLQGDTWCLLVSHNTAASKIRQLSPALLQALARAGYAVGQLRIKVSQRV